MTTNGIWQPPYNFEAARHTFIDAWPQRWRVLAPKQELVSLNWEEMNALGRQISQFGHWFSPAPANCLLNVARRLDAAIERVNRASFIRLTSRSPKDSLYAQRHGMRVASGVQALALITEGSERCAADLKMALEGCHELAIVVREWLEFPPSAEFRCFVVDRAFVGASQVGCESAECMVLTERQACEVVRALCKTISFIVAVSPAASAAIDIVCTLPSAGEYFGGPCVLLDFNPLGESTGLERFSPDMAFDMTARFCSSSGAHCIPLATPTDHSGSTLVCVTTQSG